MKLISSACGTIRGVKIKSISENNYDVAGPEAAYSKSMIQPSPGGGAGVGAQFEFGAVSKTANISITFEFEGWLELEKCEIPKK